MGHQGRCYDDDGVLECCCPLGDGPEFLFEVPTPEEIMAMMEEEER